MVANVLKEKYKVLKTEGNLNNHIGLPLTILKLKEEEVLVVEMGMNHFGEISLLTNIAKPTVCVITNIGTSHIGNLGSRENILKAKLEILEGLSKKGQVVINNDNDLLNNWAIKNKDKYNICTYGIETESKYMPQNIIQTEKDSKYIININKKEYKIKVPTPGMHFIYNSLCAVAVGKVLKIEEEKIAKGILKFKSNARRMEIVKIKEDILVINDTYNASYDSVKAALEVLGKKIAKRKIAVLGNMLELGEFAKNLHEKLAEDVIKNKIDILITVGENANYMGKKATKLGMKEIYNLINIEQATEKLNKIMQKDDLILLKASNGMKFNKILDNINK